MRKGRTARQAYLGEQVWNLSRHQEAVHDFQIRFVLHLGLSQYKRGVLPLLTTLLVQNPHVVHERVEIVRLRDGNLEGVVPRDETRQPRQTLLARPPHANEQHVAARHPQDSRHRDEMPQCIVEKHEVHPVSGKVRVVLFRKGLYHGPQVRQARTLFVHLRGCLDKNLWCVGHRRKVSPKTRIQGSPMRRFVGARCGRHRLNNAGLQRGKS